MEKSTVVIYSRGIYLNPKTPDSYSEVSADRLSLLKSAQAQNEILHKDFFICVTCYFCKIRKYLFFLCPYKKKICLTLKIDESVAKNVTSFRALPNQFSPGSFFSFNCLITSCSGGKCIMPAVLW